MLSIVNLALIKSKLTLTIVNMPELQKLPEISPQAYSKLNYRYIITVKY